MSLAVILQTRAFGFTPTNDFLPIFQMNMNASNLSSTLDNDDAFNMYMRSINLVLSCTGVLSNMILFIFLYFLGRRHCATYFLLTCMTMCDLLYCLVYMSIGLTIDRYLNIINHQILCPLSFFLSPFAFTGSTLLLLICQLHLVTQFERRYDTILGQISGRLSVVFIFAFVIIRSVLGSTSIELISDSRTPDVQHCLIDMNTPVIVSRIQTINHIFAEVTDLLVYLGWIVLLFISFISVTPCRKYLRCFPSAVVKSVDFSASRTPPSSSLNERTKTRQRHRDISFIIICLSFLSIVLYLPIMSNKLSTMDLLRRGQTLLNNEFLLVLQDIQQALHLFCLSIRVVPYLIFEQRFRPFLRRMVGWKIHRKSSFTPSHRRLPKYIFRCHCSGQRHRPQSLELHLHANRRVL